MRTIAAAVLLTVAFVDTTVFDRLTVAFDVAFVLTCVAAALAVRPRDFFVVGVLPPLSMLVIVLVLALFDRVAVAEPTDGLVQATVSGLAHHAGALVVGYTLTLAVLSLRQVAYRNAGTIRSGARPGHSSSPDVASTRTAAQPTAHPSARGDIPAQPGPSEHRLRDVR